MLIWWYCIQVPVNITSFGLDVIDIRNELIESVAVITNGLRAYADSLS